MYDVEFYITPEGRNFYKEWIRQLRDGAGRIAADRRIARMREGNFGDHKLCREGVWEMRIAMGPGYRVYYGLSGTSIVVLLCAGDKSSQGADIERAVQCWKLYQGEAK